MFPTILRAKKKVQNFRPHFSQNGFGQAFGSAKFRFLIPFRRPCSNDFCAIFGVFAAALRAEGARPI